MNLWEAGLHRKLNYHQSLIFEKLDLVDLGRRYVPASVRSVQPSLIFVLEKRDKEQSEQQVEGEQSVRNILKRVLRSGPFHRSHFWTRTTEEIDRLNAAADKLVDSLDHHDFPRIVHMTGKTPFGLKPSVVKRWLGKAH
ncbi:MAG: hypothetical protein L0Y58_23295 [Verrucomicrobia subdivision 3 bacterium]|nr:hypothetical protein [Limisphaerales bacterium]